MKSTVFLLSALFLITNLAHSQVLDISDDFYKKSRAQDVEERIFQNHRLIELSTVDLEKYHPEEGVQFAFTDSHLIAFEFEKYRFHAFSPIKNIFEEFSFGRGKGRGPEEVRDPDYNFTAMNESVVVLADHATARISKWNKQGKFLGSVRAPKGLIPGFISAYDDQL